MWLRIFQIILGVCFVLSAKANIQVKHLQVIAQPQQVQLIFSATGPLQFHHFMLHNPERIVLDIHDISVVPHFTSAILLGTPIEDIRAAIHKGNVLRLVLDLAKPVKYQTYALQPTDSKGHRLVVNLFSKNAAVPAFTWPFNKTKTETKKSKYNVIKPYQPKPVITSETAQSEKQRDLIVVIDPGHGGKDPGATGRGGAHEKQVVLSIAMDLQKWLNNQPGFKAVLTRSGDYYLTLRQRLNIARKYKADMYISIHADGYRNRQARGASVYALSSRGATSEAARWLDRKSTRLNSSHSQIS